MVHWTEDTYVESPAVIGEGMRRAIDVAEDDVTDLLALTKAHGIEPRRALDVACGIGRHTVELADAGLHVDGVDISPEYIESARERATEAGVSDRTTFGIQDVRELATPRDDYDIVLHWFAFGYFDDADNEAVAETLRETVASNGALVMGLDNKEATMADYQGSAARLRDGILKVERREYDPESGRMEALITKFRDRDDGYELVGEVTWDTRLYAPAEIRRLLERAGFSTVHLYGGLDGAALERTASPLVVVARP